MTKRFNLQLQGFVLLIYISQVFSQQRTLQDTNDVNYATEFPTVAPTIMVFNTTVASSDPKDKARNYGFLLLWGAFLLAVFVLTTYLVNVFMDRCCCCCVFEPEDMDQGLMSRKAQLFGLTLNERDKLLHRIFPRSIVWHSDEMTSASLALEISHDPSTNVQYDRMCCICLLPYEPGVYILKGKICQHIFHYSCCMEWLKNHDECPYCRRDLFTVAELRAAAKEVLGESRVQAMGFPHVDPDSVLNTSMDDLSLARAEMTGHEIFNEANAEEEDDKTSIDEMAM